MSESQIQVKLNPDVTPTGSDLSIVNSARRSFDTRSEWDMKCVTDTEYETGKYGDWEVRDTFFEPYWGHDLRKLKDKDKRLLEFLARGMTAKDFGAFLESVDEACDRDCRLDVSGDGKNLVRSMWQWRNTPTHDTPFNHTFISFEVKAPIFVARQLVKHDYLVWSEFSGRYIENLEFYRPDVWRGQPEDKKQGSEGEADSQYHPFLYSEDVEQMAIDRFKKMVGSQGVAMEQARGLMPLSTMTEWTWSGTLGAFTKMCRLRLHPEAQYESRLVAQQIYEYLKQYYPVGAKCLVEGPDV